MQVMALTLRKALQGLWCVVSGGSVVTRSARTADAIPGYVEELFRKTAKQFGFSYDAMCISDVTTCPD